MNGKRNITMGLLTMGFFMLYGFLLIYWRDFAPGKDEWIAAYATGAHFESRLAHVHGNLFGLLNIVMGYLLLQFSPAIRHANAISWLALLGLLMPLGILGEVVLGLPPVFVLIGAVAMTVAVLWLGLSCARAKTLSPGG